jgi:hypothetical protein
VLPSVVMRGFPLVWLGLAALALVLPLREPWLALLGIPGLLFAPGWALACRANRGEGGGAQLLDVLVDAAWMSVPAAALGWVLARETGLGGAAVLAMAAFGALIGDLVARGHLPARLLASPRERLALGAGAVLVACWFGLSAGTVARPLDRYWYLGGAEEELPESGIAMVASSGWAEATPIGAPEAVLLRLRPAGPQARLEAVGGAGGAFAVALHGPVGATVEGIGDRRLVVEASPVEVAEEGPVWRYRDAGVVGRMVEAQEPMLDLRFSDPGHSTLYVIGSRDALWTLHDSGELRFVHYYQLLNMVEQLAWIEERWVTDVQPPLGTWVLGPAVLFTGGGLPTAGVLLLYVLLLSTAAMTRVVSRWAPDAPLPAWLLPGAAAVVTGKLVLEPGSAGMPDALYATAIVAALAGRGEVYALVAQLLRYPGWAVVAVGLALSGETRRLGRALALLSAAVCGFALGGYATGALEGWIATVAWESGPEHWHGNFAPAELLSRVPDFSLSWLIYAGGTPVLALIRWGPGVRATLGTALVYALLLATIDHAPTHYFLPLVQLSACACACASGPSPGFLGSSGAGGFRIALAMLGCAGLLIFWLLGDIRG